MWKKILIALIGLSSCLITFFLYNYDHQLNAATQTIINATGTWGSSFYTRDGKTFTPSKHKMYMAEYGSNIIEWEFIKQGVKGNNTYLLMPTNAIAGILWMRNDAEYTGSAYYKAITSMNSGLFNSEIKLIKKGALYAEEYISLPTEPTFKNMGSFGLNKYFRAEMNEQDVSLDGSSFIPFSTKYNVGNDDVYCIFGHDFQGGAPSTIGRGEIGPCTVNNASLQIVFGFRPTAVTNANSIVFGVEPKAGIGTGSIVKTDKNPTTGDSATMKVRVLDSSLKTTLNSIGVYNSSAFQTVNKLTKNSNLVLKYSNASVANDNMISLLVQDRKTGELKYYQPLQKTTASSGEITVNTTNWDIGQYSMNIVVEKSTSDNRPVSCSALSTGFNLDIVNPLTINFTSSLGTPTYGANTIIAGASVGYITPSNGVAPYTYQILPDSSNSDGHEYFTLAQNANANGTWNVLVNGNKAPQGLPAGTYKFTITGLDANGDPVDANGKSTAKKDVTITVNKATPTLAFVNPATRKEPYVSGKVFTENVTHTNTDAGANVSFHTSNSIAQASNQNGNAQITLNTTNTTGSVIITASLPATANYHAVTATKTIEVYKGINGFQFTPSKIPTTTTDTQNGNYLIGQLSLNDGLANYTYSIDADPNGDPSDHVNAASFTLDNTPTSAKTMNVYTSGQLTAGTYKVTFKVVDSNGQVIYLPVTITISPAGQTGFDFYDDQTNALITNGTKQIPYGTTGTRVIAAGGQGNGAISYAIKSGEPINVFDLDTATGEITAIHKTGAVVVQATKAGDGNFNAITIDMTVEIIEGEQSIVFDGTVPNDRKFVANDTISIPATLTRSDGTTGSITYASTTPAICTVDDPTIAEVTMVSVGSCNVTASNNDANYESAATNKIITLYAGMSASFVQVVTPLNQGDSALDPSTNTVIAKISNLTGYQGTITYQMVVKKDGALLGSDFTINANGEILPLRPIGYGTYDVEITLEDRTGADGIITVTGQMIVGLETNASLKITYNHNTVSAIQDSFTSLSGGFSVGITGKKGNGLVHYGLSNDSHKDPNETMEAIVVNDDGTITVNRATTNDDLYKVTAYIEEDLINGYARQEANEVPITIQEGTMPSLDWTVNGLSASEVHDTYAPNKKIQLGIDGAPVGSTVTYELIEDGTGKQNGIVVDDVVRVDRKTGQLTILHTSLRNQIGLVQLQATVKCPGYTDTIMTPINVTIDQAAQTQFKFAQGVYVMPYGTGSFTPILLNGAPHDDGITYNNELSCNEPYDVTVDTAAPDTFVYIVTDPNGAMITIEAKNRGNRDYKAHKATAKLKVLGEYEVPFIVTTSPSNVISYGDRVTFIPDIAPDANISYTYTSLDDTILKQDGTNPDEFVGTGIGTIQVEITKHDTGGVVTTVFVSVRVKPKEVQVELDGPCPYEIKTGEQIPNVTGKPFQAGDLINGDVVSQPSITVDLQDTSTSGTYPITVTYPQDAITKNYVFRQVPCDLVISQDTPTQAWYQVYKQNDPTEAALNTELWYHHALTVKTIHSDYDEISQTNGNWDSSFTVSQEGEHQIPLYFKNSTTNAVSAPYEETIRIDYQKPQIKHISAKDVNTSAFARIMNAITFNTAYQPGVEVTIKAEDVLAQGISKNSGVKEVTYEVNTLKDGNIDQKIKLATASTSDVTITLSHTGEYRVCATAKDHAGNESDPLCKDINVSKNDTDVDGDGEPDFNDPDGNGCPDFNILYTDEEGNQSVLNVDADRDGVPEMDIDTDGDGIPDINVDTDKDGKPDLNLIIFTKEMWKPTQCATQHGEQYESGMTVTPKVNVDLDIKDPTAKGYHIPDINIDTEGTMIPDYNIQKKDQLINQGPLPAIWKPNYCTTLEESDFTFCTMTGLKPLLNIDTDDDGYPDLNLDTDGDQVPDLNVDTDGDLIPNINIDSKGDGIADINVSSTGDGKIEGEEIIIPIWKPEKNCNKDGFLYDTMTNFDYKTELEDQGVIITPSDEGKVFPPSYKLKVVDVTVEKKEQLVHEILNDYADREVVKVYDVQLLNQNKRIQPNGKIQVKIPVIDGLSNPSLLVEDEEGKLQPINVIVKDGYYIYEAEYLGLVSILNETKELDGSDDPVYTKKPDQNTGGVNENHTTSPVKGTYTTGGSATGDQTNMAVFLGASCCSTLVLLSFICRKKLKVTRRKID